MKTPWKLTRYLPLAARFLREGRLPELLRALADKRTPQGQRFAALKEDLQLLRALSLAWFKGEYRQISSQALLMVVAALLYFLTPLDAVPDWLVGVGFVDDLAVLAWVMRTWHGELEAFRAWRDQQSPERLALIEHLPTAERVDPLHS
ncbi:YkvA family protein [Pseudomonas sp. EggHat1]|uniref:YkvA family protein n=1 Tax=Pseudomonas sp. EggHat1 TaxID=2761624 RepID=UPI001865DF4B|nr:YkvA family protein [Pseudomonas sp. EggHat1]